MAIQYSSLVTDVNSRLAGAANKYTPDQIKSFINEGKDELWKALVATSDDYFVVPTVLTPTTDAQYFAALTTTAREFTLPANCLRPRFIEVLNPGYERVKFYYRKINHPDFTDQRNASTAAGQAGSTSTFITSAQVYFYTIVGKNTLSLARFPEIAFQLRVWYVRALADMADGSSLDETVQPYRSDIVNFAVRRAQLVGKAPEFAEWLSEWRSGIIGTVQSAGARSDTNPVFAIESDY